VRWFVSSRCQRFRRQETHTLKLAGRHRVGAAVAVKSENFSASDADAQPGDRYQAVQYL
jgi:hypothetical protein